MKMSATFDKSGVQGTPTFKMDGKTLTTDGTQNPPMTVAEFNNRDRQGAQGIGLSGGPARPRVGSERVEENRARSARPLGGALVAVRQFRVGEEVPGAW